MRVAVVGGGRVGAPVAAGFAEAGHIVVCCERNIARLRALKNARAPFDEPQLNAVIAKHLRGGGLAFASGIDAADGVDGFDVCFIAVETDAGACASLHAAAKDAAKVMGGRGVIAVKSTMPLGTGDKLAKDTGARVVVNPEFLRQGHALGDFLHPARIVIGAEDDDAITIMRAVYQPWRAPMITTSRRAAEVIKLAANYSLAARVAVINEVASLCEKNGDDVNVVIKALGYDARIQPARPGPGFGGVCLPKDCQLFAAACGNDGMVASAIVAANDARPKRLAARINKQLAKQLKDKKTRPQLAIWGVAFKGGGDDMTNSKAAQTARFIGKTTPQPSLRIHDPHLPKADIKTLPGKHYADWRASLKNADGLVVLAAHQQYASIKRAAIMALMKKDAFIFDAVGILPDGKRGK